MREIDKDVEGAITADCAVSPIGNLAGDSQKYQQKDSPEDFPKVCLKDCPEDSINNYPCVTLIGAGCGKGLITVRGLTALRQAEVLLYDALIDENLLNEVPENCVKICVGKRAGAHSASQEKIHKLLIKWAESGKRVVRLHGGDSFVFGRGSEECLALEKAGITYSVIPGVSAAIAVPEDAGIPITHRGISESFTVITGHRALNQPLDYERYAAVGGTLIFLMAFHNTGVIAEGLINAGMPHNTPASILSQGFSPEAGRLDGTLSTIAKLAEAAENLKPPAILIVGETALMHLSHNRLSHNVFSHNHLSYESYDSKRLSGISVTVTGTKTFIEKAGKKLLEEGADVRMLETLKIKPYQDAIKSCINILLSDSANRSYAYSEYFSKYSSSDTSFDWLVFTSQNGIKLFFTELFAMGKDTRALSGLTIACIGKGAAETLMEYGIIPDLVPSTYTSEALGKALSERIRLTEKSGNISKKKDRVINKDIIKSKGTEDIRTINKPKVLLLRAEQGSKALEDILNNAGIYSKTVVIYSCTTNNTGDSVDTGNRPTVNNSVKNNFIIFGSALGVHAFFKGNKANISEETMFIPIGPNTANALREYVDEDLLLPDEYSVDGIISLLLKIVT